MVRSETLLADEIHLHLVDDRSITSPSLLAAYGALISPDEAERRNRFRFAKDRHQFLVTRALLRATLSHYCADTAPAVWRFATNAFGRPRLAGESSIPLGFNLSHTQGLAIVAVSRTDHIGVDAEWIGRSDDIVDLADQFFSASERDALHALPPHLRKRQFFELWTLKEAYLKARGLGLSLPLDVFSIDFPSEGALALRIDPAHQGNVTGWHLWTLDAGNDHALSVAVAGAGTLKLRAFRSVPLVGTTEVDCSISRHM